MEGELLGAPAPAAGAAADNRPIMSVPTVLHYLQREWSRFEYDRCRWALERAELQVKNSPLSHSLTAKARIGFLEGQFQAEESLKRDLLRRIKMLEFALKQER